MADLASIEKRLRAEDIHTVQVAYADMQGHLRGKRLPARRFLEVAEQGVAFCDAALAWAIDGEVFPVDFTNWEGGYPDMRAVPDLSTFRVVPWQPGSALVMCDLLTMQGGALEVSPRRVLQRAEKAVREAGYHAEVACELEFFVLRAETLRPYYHGVQCYSLRRGAEIEFVMEPIRRHLEAFGLPTEGSNAEYGSAQVEINLRHCAPVEMADRTVLFKNAVKEMARQQGVVASFMPKPFVEESGSGLHIHQSLWDREGGKNLFASKSGLELGSTAKAYLGGLVGHFAELTALSNPSINSYKRIVPMSFAATNATWSVDNRTVGVRAALEGRASRLENRNGAADANPYYAVAANLYAGLEGVRSKAAAPAMVTGNGYAAGAAETPKTLQQALALLEGSSLAKLAFGDAVIRHYIQVFGHDVELFNTTVTDWERSRYLEDA